MHEIMHLITIRVPPERVYEALTTAEGIRHWWTRDVVLDSQIGGTGQFAFYERGTVTKVLVEDLKPPFRVVWKAVSSNAPGRWEGTTITFDLRAEGTSTVLLFAHRGFDRADEAYARLTTSWACCLVSLHLYLETGRGAPHPAVDCARIHT